VTDTGRAGQHTLAGAAPGYGTACCVSAGRTAFAITP
jgi:hypothetical protein